MLVILKNEGFILNNNRIVYGDSISLIKEKIGEPDWTSELSKKRTRRIQYSKYDVFLDFNSNDCLEFAETYTQKTIRLDDIEFSLLDPYSTLVAKLSKIADDWESDESGIVSKKVGIGFYVDGFQKEFDGFFEAVSFFPANYYSK